jgi:hypothetical protein
MLPTFGSPARTGRISTSVAPAKAGPILTPRAETRSGRPCRSAPASVSNTSFRFNIVAPGFSLTEGYRARSARSTFSTGCESAKAGKNRI